METERESPWGSRKTYVILFLCHVLGISNISTIPNSALIQGTFGYSIVLVIIYISMGIPLLYMESVVGQYTARDCIDVWKIRPCLSYVGYLLLVWQIFTLIYNQTLTSLILHYFLISFETPIPFYTCGSWSTRYCNNLVNNYTVNLDCVKNQNLFPYCENLYQTFPEYQYWRMNVVQAGNGGFYIAWRVCLASGLICLIIFLGCFRRSKSVILVINIFVCYPLVALALLMMGSMRQKGLVAKYEEVIDLDFSTFVEKFRFSTVIQNVVFNLGIGSGLTFNLASTAPFRSPCFSDTVVTVVICVVFTIFFTFTLAMVTCPYSFKYGTIAGDIIKTPMSLTFEKIPRFLFEYQNKMFYIVVVYSCFVIIAINSILILFYNLLEVIFNRNPKLAKYPGLTVFCAVIILYLLTIPFLSYNGVNIMAYTFRRYFTLIATFIGALECLVFVFWYGINRFSEDIHFMLGIQPNSCMKIAWGLSVFFLIYGFVCEIYNQFQLSFNHKYVYATYFILCFAALIFVAIILRLLIAVVRKRFGEFVALDQTWGPRNEILQRSRGMFSAQAMTKEYIYRQYHLQAGILQRQIRSNRRSPIR